MAKKKKQFSPHIYAEWGELFDTLTTEQKAEVLDAITKYPNYEPKNVPIWNFINSQIKKDYEIFITKCEKNGEISRNYWNNKTSNDTERIPNDTERYPKRITNNELHKQITETENNFNVTDFTLSKEYNIYRESYTKTYGTFTRLNTMQLKVLRDNFKMIKEDYKDRNKDKEMEIDTFRDCIDYLLKELKSKVWNIDGRRQDATIFWLLKNGNFSRFYEECKLKAVEEMEIKNGTRYNAYGYGN